MICRDAYDQAHQSFFEFVNFVSQPEFLQQTTTASTQSISQLDQQNAVELESSLKSISKINEFLQSQTGDSMKKVPKSVPKQIQDRLNQVKVLQDNWRRAYNQARDFEEEFKTKEQQKERKRESALSRQINELQDEIAKLESDLKAERENVSVTVAGKKSNGNEYPLIGSVVAATTKTTVASSRWTSVTTTKQSPSTAFGSFPAAPASASTPRAAPSKQSPRPIGARAKSSPRSSALPAKSRNI